MNGGPLERTGTQEDFGHILNAIVNHIADRLLFYRFATPKDP